MKKILAIILIIFLCFTFTACKADEVQDDTITSTEQTQEDETTTSDEDIQEDEIEDDEVETDEVEETDEDEQDSQDETTTQNITTTTSTSSNQTTTQSSSTTTTTTTKTESTTASTTTTKSTTTTTKAPTTTTTTTSTTTQPQYYCYVTIDMTTALNNINDFTSAKASFVPSSGILLSKVKVYYTQGETLFDAILKACSENVCSDNCKYCQSSGIQIEYQYTPAYSSYYIEGVHQIYEMDCGVMSGWMVYVNGESIQSSSSTIEIQNGDSIVLAYTCSMGSDINF